MRVFASENRLLTLTQLFALVRTKQMSRKEAAVTSGYSYWHLTRLYRRALAQGVDRLFAPPRVPCPRKLLPEHVAQIKQLYARLGQPQLSLLLHFLPQEYPSFPPVSEEWLRRLLIREQVYAPGTHQPTFRRRFEAPAPGVLVQGDSTAFQWIPGDKTYYQFIAFLDDCTRVCLAAALCRHDTIVEHFRLLRQIVRRRGRFVALYYDNDEKYSYIRHRQSRHYTYHTDQADLQVVRALAELGINVINSKLYDPCGKGKIERFIETVQLQLPVWLRRYDVRNLEQAQPVLGRYLGYYNGIRPHRELGCPPLTKYQRLAAASRFAAVGNGTDLARVFSFRHLRTVDRANTVRLDGVEYQLEPDRQGHTYCGKQADIRRFPGEPVRIYISGRLTKSRRLLTVSRPERQCHIRSR